MIVVDVDNLNRFIQVTERNRPVRSFDQVVVDSALVVTVMQASRSSEREEPAVIHPIDDRFSHDFHIISSRFSEERPAAGCFIRQGSHHFIRTWRILTEDRGVFPFHRIKNRYLVVTFFPDVRVFNHLAVVRADRNQRRRTIERAQCESHGQQSAEQDTSTVAHRHECDGSEKSQSFRNRARLRHHFSPAVPEPAEMAIMGPCVAYVSNVPAEDLRDFSDFAGCNRHLLRICVKTLETCVLYVRGFSRDGFSPVPFTRI